MIAWNDPFFGGAFSAAGSVPFEELDAAGRTEGDALTILLPAATGLALRMVVVPLVLLVVRGTDGVDFPKGLGDGCSPGWVNVRAAFGGGGRMSPSAFRFGIEFDRCGGGYVTVVDGEDSCPLIWASKSEI